MLLRCRLPVCPPQPVCSGKSLHLTVAVSQRVVAENKCETSFKKNLLLTLEWQGSDARAAAHIRRLPGRNKVIIRTQQGRERRGPRAEVWFEWVWTCALWLCSDGMHGELHLLWRGLSANACLSTWGGEEEREPEEGKSLRGWRNARVGVRRPADK